MKNIFVINDNSPEAEHAAEFALTIAHQLQVNILLANTVSVQSKPVQKVMAGITNNKTANRVVFTGTQARLTAINNKYTGFKPAITTIDITGMDESELAATINKSETDLVVKGTNNAASSSKVNINTVLSRVHSPLLLVPQNWAIKNIERLTYIADLRYCRLHVVRALAAFAKPWLADLAIAHLSAKGLPDMAESYAKTVFAEEVSRNVNYKQLFFNNIKEKNLAKAVDVMINGMHNDLLVLVNRRFHFEEIIGKQITDTHPVNITVPVLVFPC